jgi:hypothetical protein
MSLSAALSAFAQFAAGYAQRNVVRSHPRTSDRATRLKRAQRPWPLFFAGFNSAGSGPARVARNLHTFRVNYAALAALILFLSL